MNLSKAQLELLEAMQNGVVCSYSPSRGRFNPVAHYRRSDTLAKCTQTVTSLYKRGLVARRNTSVPGHHELFYKSPEQLLVEKIAQVSSSLSDSDLILWVILSGRGMWESPNTLCVFRDSHVTRHVFQTSSDTGLPVLGEDVRTSLRDYYKQSRRKEKHEKAVV